jgi:Periplasmic binding protein
MQAPPPPTRRRSPLMRYAPFIAIVVVIAVIAVIAANSGGSKGKVKTENTAATAKREIPITYNEAKAAGTVTKYTWQPNCDPSTGKLALPLLSPPPCVPTYNGTNNGGANGSPGVSASTITIAYYVAKPDPQTDALTKAVGAYDTPDQVTAGVKEYMQIFEKYAELYGRTIKLVLLHGTGAATDDTAARADAIKAADELHAFAVIGGPSQSKAFADELTSRGVMCIGTCLIAQPQSFYAAHPGLFGVGPLPEQPADDTVELIKKQLEGKDAIYAGDPKLQKEKRKFALLTYDTPDGQFKPVWDAVSKQMAADGMPLATHVSYFLDLTTAQADARTLITKLKTSGATSVIFSGDPLMPEYFTAEATKQNYHPEWIISGTVYADTDVFARSYDQSQWSHAFGIGLVGAQSPEPQHQDYLLHEWYFSKPPPDINTSGIVEGDVQLLFTGLQLAGPHLTVANFTAGMQNQPVPPESPDGLFPIITFGKHGLWPGTDYGGLDNVNLIWWDPTAVGPDETGTVGKGMYRYVDDARRYLPGHFPTTPIKLFDPTDTITQFVTTPPSLLPHTYPKPPQ